MIYMKSILTPILFFVSVTFFAQNQENVLSNKLNEPYYENDMLTPSFHKNRREALRNLMPDGSVSVIFAGPIRNRSNDVDFEFHQDPNFYYLTGIDEPHAVLLIFKDSIEINGEKTAEIAFVQKRNPSAEVWTGKRLGDLGVESYLGIDMAKNGEEFSKLNLDWSSFSSIHFIKPQSDVRDDPYDKADLYGLIQHFLENLEEVEKNKWKNRDIRGWMAQLRQDKLEEEIVLMRRAVEITCLAQQELMKALKPEMKEYQSEAIIEYVFKMNGAEYPGFPSIQGSGENSCVLHYVTNRRTMKGNNLLVSDVGAEYHGYTADVTRTIPVDGTFSEEEKAIYNIVLEAQEAGIKASQVGNRFWDPNIAATTVISQRLMELGIIKTPIEMKRYFMHGTSHYVGLDVHDAGLYAPLAENQVITVEPGIYIPEGSPCDPKWWNIGVRIEDDVLITKDGPVVMSACVPKTIDEIEALMKEKSTLIK